MAHAATFLTMLNFSDERSLTLQDAMLLVSYSGDSQNTRQVIH